MPILQNGLLIAEEQIKFGPKLVPHVIK
jgi:hypothetical protein